jgi:hypothetical protein
MSSKGRGENRERHKRVLRRSLGERLEKGKLRKEREACGEVKASRELKG